LTRPVTLAVLAGVLVPVVFFTLRSAGIIRSTALAPFRVSLASYYNNIGITSNSEPAVGNLDGSGSVFSAQALAADGVRPGATISSHHVPFTWPDVIPGMPDNVTASGQALRASGSGKMLSFLVTAGWGPASGTGQVVYTDGSAQKFTIGAPDWLRSCSSREAAGVAVRTPYFNLANGRVSLKGCVFYASVPLQARKKVERIVLPNLSAPVPGSGDRSLHIFAITIH
jgi:hypothetical protein